MLTIDFAQASLPASGALALLVPDGAALTGLAAAADQATGGALARAFAAAKFTGKKGSAARSSRPAPACPASWRSGLGKPRS